MEKHRSVFTDYLRQAPRLSNGQRIDWTDWLDEQALARCEVCGEYGQFGDEVSYLPEGSENPGNNSNSRICHACTVTAWAWTNAEMMLTVTCPRGEEEDWLRNQARHFGDTSGLREWGYADRPSHVKFHTEGNR